MSPSQSKNGHIINLSPNSLYICLTQLMFPGKFHWSLFITNDEGVATRIHWKENNDRKPGNHTEPAEIYFTEKVDPVTELTSGYQMHLAFLRLRAFTPTTNNFDYDAVLSKVFSTGYSTIKANRDNNLTCRTWLLAALQVLRQHGLIELGESQIADLEAKAISAGLEAETLFSKQGSLFKTPVAEL